MTFFQLKSFSFINYAIKRIVKHIKSNTRKQCFFVNLTNSTFWKDTPRGQEILEFFKGMTTDSQKIEFFCLFDIFVVGFHNGINAFISMTADPSSRNFEKTLWVSISKGYNRFSENFSGRGTPSIEGDLRSSIGSTPVQSAGFSTSPDFRFQDSSVENAFQQGLSTFGQFQGFGGQATQPFFSFQGFGGPANGFSRICPQEVSSQDPFVSQQNFIPINDSNSCQGQTRLEIRKGRIVSVEIPSGCSSGPSTSSTIGRIAKSPKPKTPISTTISILKNKIARLEKGNPTEGSLDHSELLFAKAKLKKIQTSL